jgi:transposase-like protein
MSFRSNTGTVVRDQQRLGRLTSGPRDRHGHFEPQLIEKYRRRVAAAQLEEFETGPWGQKYPTIAQSWRRKWEQVIPFFSFAPEIRRIIYTTNAIESLHSQVRKSVRSHGHFPSDQAATKLIWLVLRNIEAKWKRPPMEWAKAKNQFAILFGERFKITD